MTIRKKVTKKEIANALAKHPLFVSKRFVKRFKEERKKRR